MSLAHLARRFFGSLNVAPLSAADQEWAQSWLLPGEVELWGQMNNADQAHAVRVARDVAGRLGTQTDRVVLSAALLHDIGKLQSGYGTFGRVFATVAGHAGARFGRIGVYMNHHELGSEMLSRAGSDPLTVAWAREHELPSSEWTIDRSLANALYAADDE